ncbi:MAG: hypothetical protein CMF61_02370 [Magnetococcales bacterium]|nr:hypothetical protein [Magnetococcales bacterium]
MTSTNTKLLLASTALVSAIAVAGSAQAADVTIATDAAAPTGFTLTTDANSDTNVDSGDVVTTSGAISLAAATDSIDVTAAGATVTVSHTVTGATNVDDALVKLTGASNTLNINAVLDATTGTSTANAHGVLVLGSSNTINVNSTITEGDDNAPADGINIGADINGTTINVSSTGSAGDIDAAAVTTATNTVALNVTGGTVGAYIGSAGVDTITVSGSNQSNLGAVALGAADDTMTLSGTDSAATVVASIAGDAGTDTLNVTSGVNTITGALATVENVNVSGGTTTVGGNVSGVTELDITGGTLNVTGTTGAASVTIDSGATLNTTGANTLTGNLVVNGNMTAGAATVAATGITVNTGTLYQTGNLTATAGGLTVGSTGTVSTTGVLTVTAGDLTVASGGKVTGGANTVVTAGDATIAGTYTEAGNFSMGGANSLVTVSGTLDVTGTVGAASITTTAGSTFETAGVATISGNVVVAGNATFGDTVADDSTVAGKFTAQNGSNVLINADLTTITALSVADGAKVVVADGALLEADTGVSSLKNVTLELADANDTSGRVTFSGEKLAPSGAPVKLTVAQGVTITDGRTYNQIITGNAAPDAISATSNALYTYTWTVDTNSYDLTVNLKNAGVTTLAGAATGSNNKGVATVVDSAALATLYSDVMAQSDTDAALESLNPDVSGGAGAASINTTVASTGTVSNRLALLRGTDNGRSGMVAGEEMMANREMWLQAFGTSVEQDERKGVKGFDATTSGLAIGVDTDELVHGARVGVAFSYAQADVDSDQSNNAQTDIDTYQLTAYGSKDLANDMYVDAMVSYAWNSHEGSRVDFLGDTYTSDYDGNQFSVKGEVGKSYDWANTRVTPNVSLHYINVETDSYREAGAAGNGLSVNTDDQEAFLLSIGSDIEWNITGRDGSEYMPYLRAKYSYDMMGDEVETTSTFLAGGSAFTSEGADIARSSLGLGAGVNVVTTSGFEFTAGYDAEIKEDFLAHTGMLQARWSF